MLLTSHLMVGVSFLVLFLDGLPTDLGTSESIFQTLSSQPWSRSEQDRLWKPKRSLVTDVLLPLCQRTAQAMRVLSYLSQRATHPEWSTGRLDAKAAYHVCLPATPGLGKSRLLQALACCLVPEDVTVALDEYDKREIGWLSSMISSCRGHAAAADGGEGHALTFDADFLTRFSVAARAVITFNNGCERVLDPRSLASVVGSEGTAESVTYHWNEGQALAVRLLWDHFADPSLIQYQQFVEWISNASVVPSFSDALLAILGNIDGRDLVLCIDECAAVGRASSIEGMLTMLGAATMQHQRLHTVMSSVSYDLLHHAMPTQTGSLRDIKYASLDRLTNTTMDSLCQTFPWWATILGKSAAIKQLCMVAVRATLGCPRLFRHVTTVLESMSGRADSAFTWQVFSTCLNETFTFSQAAGSIATMLPVAAEMALRGEPLNSSDTDGLAVAGLILRSHAVNAVVPVLSPLWAIVMGPSTTLLRHVSDFLQHTPWVAADASEAGKKFEPQVVTAFKIRMMLASTPQSTLSQLLTVNKVAPKYVGERTHIQVRFGADYDVVYFGKDGSLSTAEFNDRMRGNEMATSCFYVPTNRAAAGFDMFIVHADKSLTVLQIKFSQFFSQNLISNADVATSLTNTLRAHDWIPTYLESGTGVFVFFAKREAHKNVGRDGIRENLGAGDAQFVDCTIVCDGANVDSFLTPSLNIFDQLAGDPTAFTTDQ